MSSPLDVLKEATKAYPAANIVWAAIAVSAAVAVISAFNLGIETLTSGGIFVLAIVAAFAVVSLFHRMLSKVEDLPGARLLAGVIAWSFTLFLLGFIAGLMSSFFFGVPRELQELFSALRPLAETTQAAPEVVADTLEPIAPGLEASPSQSDAIAGLAPDTETAAESAVQTCLGAIDLALPLAQFEEEVRACDPSQ